MTITISEIIKGLLREMPLGIREFVDLKGKKVGFAKIDLINGFCKAKAGNLAPPVEDEKINKMIDEADKFAREAVDNGIPVVVFIDTHKKGKPEPPYPVHCEEGTEEAELVDKLKWLMYHPLVLIIPKDCINGFVGAIRPDGTNAVVEWVVKNQVEVLVVDGICTDICVLQFVQTILSARNHGMFPALKDVVVITEACSTYDLPREIAEVINLPVTLAHPREITDYVGFYLMQSSGAILTKNVIF